MERGFNTAGDKTRVVLLDSAEQVFAAKGFHGASVRDITAHAGLRVAAVNYYFESKEQLYREVFLRRAEALHDRQRRALAERVRSGGQTERVRGIVRAYVAPTAAHAARGKGFRAHLSIAALAMHSQDQAHTLVADSLHALAGDFCEALVEVYPRVTPRARLDAYQHVAVCTLHVLSSRVRTPSLGGIRAATGTHGETADRLVRFASAGVQALCRTPR